MEEIWKDVPGYPGYQVSDMGRVRSNKAGHGRRMEDTRILKQNTNQNGYQIVDLCINGTRKAAKVHRIVAMTFIPNSENKNVVNHINGYKKDNRVINLEWCTSAENNRHALDTGLNNNSGKITKSVRIKETGELYDSIADCARALNIDERTVARAMKDGHETAIGLHFEYIGDKIKEKQKFLYDYQIDAVNRMRNGTVLNGGTGSGKSRTGLYYYFKENGGNKLDGYIPMNDPPQDLYIITTATKRDRNEWEDELALYLMSTNPKLNLYCNKIVVDSWNNIEKYINVQDSFFIFDEQHVVGYGKWSKSFIMIAKKNNWIMLSATAGDKFEDYIPLFIANGFYKNKSEFSRKHLIYSTYTKYPKVTGYMDTGHLEKLRRQILIDMDFNRNRKVVHEDVYCDFEVSMYKKIMKDRWNPWEDKPIKNASELCYLLRKVVNSDMSRQIKVRELFKQHNKLIIFYSFNYEREILLNIPYGDDVEIAELSGHKHQTIPDSEKWVYLVNYSSGSDAWNCILTDTIIFFSQNYSYRTTKQACGRIDRLNTPYEQLYYYHLKSRSGIDVAISKALSNKKKFNEGKFVGQF